MRAILQTLLVFALALPLGAEDPGKEVVARLNTVLLLGTDGELAKIAPEAKKADAAHIARLRPLKELTFANYAFIGSDVKPIWRSYTNWASPMKESQEILLSFEPNSQAEQGEVRLDLELWQSKRKVMKTTQSLSNGKWLYIAGPRWRGGRLILGIELLPLESK